MKVITYISTEIGLGSSKEALKSWNDIWTRKVAKLVDMRLPNLQ